MKYFFSALLLLIIVPFSLQARDAGEKALVASVSADFSQEKHLPILARPLVSSGRFVFQAPQSLRWEYFSPLQTVLLMNDGEVRKFIRHDGVFREEKGMGVDAMHIVLQEISGWLDGDISETPTFSVESVQDKLIVLTPRKESFSHFISRIELRLADRAGLMESVTLYEGKDSYTRMVFTNGVLNEQIAAETFASP